MKKQQKTLLLWVVVIFIMAFVMKVLEQKTTVAKRITYSQFITSVDNKNIESVSFKGTDIIKGKFVPGYEKGQYFESTGATGAETFKILRAGGITPNYIKEEKQGLLSTIFINWFPMLLIIFLFYMFLRQMQSGGGKAMSFGKSKAKMLNENDKKVTFKDVSGIEEAKEELVEVVDFLKEPKKYTKLGGKIPKGVLLVGPPGTGKTLLARAVAGEAGVPFFSISGSDFVEMFVGVGASRVRDLFDQGKKHAPCIIFIDEIDAVGRHRGAGMGGGHDEREQTLNQMLVEMDGFESNEGVIIMAATNRADVLDPALLRPGRFDRRVEVGRPDIRGRLGILKVHTVKTPMAEKINLETIAKGTPGFTGADLANLVNEAALLAARAGKEALEMIDFENAKDKVLMGVERRSMVISDIEKRNTAFHEAGHTLVGLKLKHTDPIHKVTIIPRGGALGVTMTLPNEDRLSLTRDKSKDLIAFMMGGRVAEEIEFGDFTNGATNDIEKATELAHAMVCDWGMSEAMGPISYGQSKSAPFVGMQQQGQNPYSEQTAQAIDTEVNTFVLNGYNTAKKILTEEKDTLDRLAEALIIWETLDSVQVNAICDGKDIGLPTIDTSSDDDTKGIIAKDDEEKKEEDVKDDIPTGSGDPSPA